ncbi:hypothetical protein [Streptomyces decoyicus]|uniref:hypothetical protein n=1 Tax=Streptomyces decoyicus TaxID=249567 RepID=UPI0038079DCA
MSEWVEPLCPPRQLQPVAVTSNGDDIFWLMEPPENPDRWKVTVNDLDSEDWFIFDGPFTAFLLSFCTNDVIVPSFPDDLLGKSAYFTPTP